MTRDEATRCAQLYAQHLADRSDGDPLEPYYCRCDHPHHPDAAWCYVCENPIAGAQPASELPPD